MKKAEMKSEDSGAGKMGDSMDGMSEAEMKAGYRCLDKGEVEDGGAMPGNDGEYEYKPGSTKNDSRAAMMDPGKKKSKMSSGY